MSYYFPACLPCSNNNDLSAFQMLTPQSVGRKSGAVFVQQWATRMHKNGVAFVAPLHCLVSIERTGKPCNYAFSVNACLITRGFSLCNWKLVSFWIHAFSFRLCGRYYNAALVLWNWVKLPLFSSLPNHPNNVRNLTIQYLVAGNL